MRAEGLTAKPTLHDLSHELTYELLHVDSKIFRTVWLLLRRPGLLTREYFAGRRARYIPPIRLYLVFSVIYFAIAALAREGPAPIKVTYTPTPWRDS